MAEAFVPLFIADEKKRDTAFFPVHQRPPSAQSPVSPPAALTPPAGAVCGKPTVTLQRTGDTVTSIRVQCPCGQVIDLACVF